MSEPETNPFECTDLDVEDACPTLQLLDSDHEEDSDVEIEVEIEMYKSQLSRQNERHLYIEICYCYLVKKLPYVVRYLVLNKVIFE